MQGEKCRPGYLIIDKIDSFALPASVKFSKTREIKRIAKEKKKKQLNAIP